MAFALSIGTLYPLGAAGDVPVGAADDEVVLQYYMYGLSHAVLDSFRVKQHLRSFMVCHSS